MELGKFTPVEDLTYSLQISELLETEIDTGSELGLLVVKNEEMVAKWRKMDKKPLDLMLTSIQYIL